MSEVEEIEGYLARATRIIREATGLHENLAQPIAAAIIDSFRKDFGGERIYYGRRDPELARRVLADFNGRNRQEVMRRHGISRRTFYRILQRARRNRGTA